MIRNIFHLDYDTHNLDSKVIHGWYIIIIFLHLSRYFFSFMIIFKTLNNNIFYYHVLYYMLLEKPIFRSK